MQEHGVQMFPSKAREKFLTKKTPLFGNFLFNFFFWGQMFVKIDSFFFFVGNN